MIFFNSFPAAEKIDPEVSIEALDRWHPEIRTAASDEPEIGIMERIGSGVFEEGVTSKRIKAALSRIGSDRDITVNINSPGGNYFEAAAIYNLLRQHEGQVTVRVLGIAASAASIIAMAASKGRLQIAKNGFFMIHNAWVSFVGDRNDLRSMADELETYDDVASQVYAGRSNLPVEQIRELMDAETVFGADQAIEDGFADSLLDVDLTQDQSMAEPANAQRQMDVALAKSGLSRSERRRLFQAFKSSTQNAAGGGKPSAVADTPCAVEIEASPLMRLTLNAR